MKKIESEIKAVTDYTDRALITRSGKITLESGEQHLVFNELPESIEQKSIRVVGKGNAILRDINFKTVYFAEVQNDLNRKIIKKQNDLKEQLNQQYKQIELANLEREFLNKITEKITSPEKNQKAGELNPDSWIQMISFYRSKLEDLEQQKSQSEKVCRDIKRELQKLASELSQLEGGSDKTRNQVEVTVDMKEEGDLILQLDYMVYGTGWYPVYDLRVSTKEKNMNITYNAMVTQTTSEDWNGVKLKLSTARPQIDGTIPALSPWHIDMYRAMESPMRSSMHRIESPSMSKKSESYDSEVCEEPVLYGESMSMPIAETNVETQAASVVFVPSGSNTIPSDNSPHKVTVLIQDFDAEFKYGSVPKLSPFTYLNARVENNSDYPLLEGDCNVFLDNNYVSNVFLKTVAPGEEFWSSLGIDESINVEKKFIRRFEKKEGIIGKKKKFIYEYLFVIENKRKTDEILILQDQIPISGHQDIMIELLSPKMEKNTENPKINDEKILEWALIPKAGEKIEIPFSFSVEYPKNETVTGLE